MLAQRLAEDGPDAVRLREAIGQTDAARSASRIHRLETAK